MKTIRCFFVSVALIFAFMSTLNAKVINPSDSHIKAILGSQCNLLGFHNNAGSAILLSNSANAGPANESVADNTSINNYSNSLNSAPHQSSGSDDNGLKGKNIITAGVGFVSLTGLLAGAWTTAGYSGSSVLPISIQYERGLSSNFTFGLSFVYSSVSMSYSGTMDNTNSYYPYNSGQLYNYTDKLSLSGMEIAVTGDYYFVTSGVFQPYLGFRVGYEPISFGWSTNDPNSKYGDGNIAQAWSWGSGVPCWGLYFGTKIWFSNNFGAWVDGGWHGIFGAIFNLGLAAKF